MIGVGTRVGEVTVYSQRKFSPAATQSPLDSLVVFRLVGSQVTCVTPKMSTQVRKASATAVSRHRPHRSCRRLPPAGATIDAVLGSEQPAPSSGASGIATCSGTVMLRSDGDVDGREVLQA